MSRFYRYFRFSRAFGVERLVALHILSRYALPLLRDPYLFYGLRDGSRCAQASWIKVGMPLLECLGVLLDFDLALCVCSAVAQHSLSQSVIQLVWPWMVMCLALIEHSLGHRVKIISERGHLLAIVHELVDGLLDPVLAGLSHRSVVVGRLALVVVAHLDQSRGLI